MESDPRGMIYIGAAFEFGYLQPDEKGLTECISLASRIDSINEIRYIYSIVEQNDRILFLSPKFLYIYNINNDSLTSISLVEFNLIEASMSDGKYLLETIKGRKISIGISSRMDEKFAFEEWPLEKGISYYLFSDGYIDQFGGPNGKKFMERNIKRLILNIQDYSMNKQKELFDDNLNKWMENTPQIDDILVIGIRIE